MKKAQSWALAGFFFIMKLFETLKPKTPQEPTSGRNSCKSGPISIGPNISGVWCERDAETGRADPLHTAGEHVAILHEDIQDAGTTMHHYMHHCMDHNAPQCTTICTTLCTTMHHYMHHTMHHDAPLYAPLYAPQCTIICTTLHHYMHHCMYAPPCTTIYAPRCGFKIFFFLTYSWASCQWRENACFIIFNRSSFWVIELATFFAIHYASSWAKMK